MVGFGFYSCLQTIPHATGCQIRTKSSVHSNSITRPNNRTRYAHRDDTISAAHCLECTSPKWINLLIWIAWEIWYHRLTNRTTDPEPPIKVRRVGGLDGEVDWSTVPVKGHFDGLHNQWLTHWHSYQTVDLFNRRVAVRPPFCIYLHSYICHHWLIPARK